MEFVECFHELHSEHDTGPILSNQSLVSLQGNKGIVKTNRNKPDFQVILTLMLVVKK